MAVSLKRSVDGTFGDDAIGRNLADANHTIRRQV